MSSIVCVTAIYSKSNRFDALGVPDTSSSKRTCSFGPSSSHFLKNSCMPEAQDSFDNTSNAVKAKA